MCYAHDIDYAQVLQLISLGLRSYVDAGDARTGIAKINDARMAERKIYRIWLAGFLMLLGWSAVAQETGPDTLQLESMIIEAGKQKMLGNMDKAQSIYMEIMDKHPGHSLASYELARILLKKDDTEEALKYAGQAAKGDPSNTWYQTFLAVIYAEMGRYRDAAGVYEQLVKVFPLEKSYYQAWAGYQESAGQLAAAIRIYDDMDVRFGIQELFIRQKADLYLKLGDAKKAAREWEKLSAAFPRTIPYFYALAEFYEKNGEKEKAIAAYRKVLELDARDSRALAAVAGAGTGASGNPSRELNDLVANRDVDPALKIARIKPLADPMALGKDPALASDLIALCTRLEALHPGASGVFELSGQILRLSGRPAEALPKYKRALELEENNYAVWEQMLGILRDKGDSPTLLREAANALELFPNRPLLYYFEALGQYWQEEPAKAKNNLDQALFMTAQDPAVRQEILTLLGLVHTSLKDAQAADQAFQEARAAFATETPLFLARLACSLAERNKEPDASMQYARRAYELAPQQVETANALALNFYKRNQWQETRQTLEPFLANNNPQVLEHYGDALFRLGQSAEALKYWDQARNTGNRSARLLKKISDKQLYE